jgi:hypothetical protein
MISLFLNMLRCRMWMNIEFFPVGICKLWLGRLKRTYSLISY